MDKSKVLDMVEGWYGPEFDLIDFKTHKDSVLALVLTDNSIEIIYFFPAPTAEGGYEVSVDWKKQLPYFYTTGRKEIKENYREIIMEVAEGLFDQVQFLAGRLGYERSWE